MHTTSRKVARHLLAAAGVFVILVAVAGGLALATSALLRDDLEGSPAPTSPEPGHGQPQTPPPANGEPPDGSQGDPPTGSQGDPPPAQGDPPPAQGDPPDGSPDGPVVGSPGDTPDSRTSVFDQADQRMREMVDTRARWHAPSRTPVAETTEVGLSIGNGEELRRQVEETLPEVPTQPGVPLRVGTDVSARLVGEPSDVSISPSDAIDASTGSDIALLWTWNIHPKHPNDRLKLSAHLTMTVPGTEHKLTRTLNLVLSVTRTASYTAHQVFTNYGTWAAIAAGSVAAIGWLRRNFNKKQEPSMSRPPPQYRSATTRVSGRAGVKKRRDSRDRHSDRRVESGTAPGSETTRSQQRR